MQFCKTQNLVSSLGSNVQPFKLHTYTKLKVECLSPPPVCQGATIQDGVPTQAYLGIQGCTTLVGPFFHIKSIDMGTIL